MPRTIRDAKSVRIAHLCEFGTKQKIGRTIKPTLSIPTYPEVRYSIVPR